MARPTLRDTISAQEEQIGELLKANEQIWSSYSLLERRIEDLSYIDLNNIFQANQDIIPQHMRVATINRIRRLRQENPMAKQAIKLPIRFVLGRGIGYEINEANTARIVDDFWNDPVNQAVWTSHFAMTLAFDELLTDGEQFPVFFATPNEPPYVRMGLVPMTEITHVLCDPDNGRMPIWYRRAYRQHLWDPTLNNNEGGWATDPQIQLTVRYYRNYRVTDDYLADVESRGLKIPENLVAPGVIKHRMINPIYMRSGLRGMSELFASREWFRVFKEFMEDRGAINASANALAYQRKISGTPADVARMSGKIGGMQLGPQTDQPLTPSSFRRPLAGTIIDSNRSDISQLKVDTGAPNASRDAELFITAAGAGTATPSHYFGGSNAALAGAQAVEVAVVKAFEEFQTYLRNDLQETIEYVLSVARDVPITDVGVDARKIAWSFPPIMTQDIVKWTTAFAQWSQQVAPGNRAVRSKAIRHVAEVLNVSDIDMVWDEIATEEKRIADEQDAAKQAALAQPPPPIGPLQTEGIAGRVTSAQVRGQTEALLAGNPSATNGNGAQKVTTGPQPNGLSPEVMRLQRGRPPAEGATGPRSKRQ